MLTNTQPAFGVYIKWPGVVDFVFSLSLHTGYNVSDYNGNSLVKGVLEGIPTCGFTLSTCRVLAKFLSQRF